jgi:hypothetical protein
MDKQAKLLAEFKKNCYRLIELKKRIPGKVVPMAFMNRLVYCEAMREMIVKRHNFTNNIVPSDYEQFFDSVGELLIKEPT